MASYRLRCPECRDKFPWDAQSRWPRYCPLCQADINNDRDDDDIVMPAFLSARTKETDKVYNDMVKGSEFRAQAAADLAGVPVSEMSSLKITDLNTRRDAEIMAVTPNNPVSQLMAQGIGGFQGATGGEYGGAVSTGPFPNVGAATRTMIQKQHPSSATSDQPALETMAPTYRRRG